MNLPGESQKENTSAKTGPHIFDMPAWISCAPFERLLNMEIQEAKNGKAILSMPFLQELSQGAGLMHGGALVSLADTAMAMAMKSILPPMTHFATIKLESSFKKAVTKGYVKTVAEITSRDDRIIHGKAIVYDEEEQEIMHFSSVFKIAKNSEIKNIRFKNI